MIQTNQEKQCIVAVIRHGWAIQCFVYVWEAWPVKMNRQKQEMIKIHPIGWKCFGIACILIIINTYDNICCMLDQQNSEPLC